MYCENRKHLATIMNDSAITCDEVIESNDKETNFNEKKKRKQPVKSKISIFYLHFYYIFISYRRIIDSC